MITTPCTFYNHYIISVTLNVIVYDWLFTMQIIISVEPLYATLLNIKITIILVEIKCIDNF